MRRRIGGLSEFVFGLGVFLFGVFPGFRDCDSLRGIRFALKRWENGLATRDGYIHTGRGSLHGNMDEVCVYIRGDNKAPAWILSGTNA
jgi:hypothetical protein